MSPLCALQHLLGFLVGTFAVVGVFLATGGFNRRRLVCVVLAGTGLFVYVVRAYHGDTNVSLVPAGLVFLSSLALGLVGAGMRWMLLPPVLLAGVIVPYCHLSSETLGFAIIFYFIYTVALLALFGIGRGFNWIYRRLSGRGSTLT